MKYKTRLFQFICTYPVLTDPYLTNSLSEGITTNSITITAEVITYYDAIQDAGRCRGKGLIGDIKH